MRTARERALAGFAPVNKVAEALIDQLGDDQSAIEDVRMVVEGLIALDTKTETSKVADLLCMAFLNRHCAKSELRIKVWEGTRPVWIDHMQDSAVASMFETLYRTTHD